MKRILLIGDAPYLQTGYSIQLKNIGKRLLELKNEVIYFDTSFPMDNYKNKVYRMDQFLTEYFDKKDKFNLEFLDVRDEIGESVICFKKTNSPFPYEDIREVVLKTQPDCFILLKDLNNFPEEIKINIPSIAYVPIDTEPISESILKKLKCFDKIISIAEYGKIEMCKYGYDVDFIPHSIDPNLIDKVLKKDKNELKKKYGIPLNKFIVGMIASNTESNNRKGWDFNLYAYNEFCKDKEDVFLFINTNMDGRNNNKHIHTDLIGLDLLRYMDLIKCNNSKWTTIPNVKYRTYTQEEIYEQYLCFDVLLSVSRGEGCSVCLLEAQSLGVPVITSNFTAMKENCIYGELIDPYFLGYTGSGAFHIIPKIEDIIKSLNKFYLKQIDNKQKECMDYIKNKCDYKKCGDMWIDMIEKTIHQHKKKPIHFHYKCD